MRKQFNEQLSTLSSELITMGALCEEAISNAVRYLISNDEEAKDDCLEADRQIDQKERDIETLCIRLLLMQQPVAKDLRIVSAALKMISDMERIGDQASDIVEISPYISQNDIRSSTHIEDMANAAIKMVTDSIESFVRQDIETARRAIEYDDVVDGLFDKVKEELITAVSEGHENAESFVDLLMTAKYFERIGDHAENIAGWVIYSVTGKRIY